jgi:transposase-like protein
LYEKTSESHLLCIGLKGENEMAQDQYKCNECGATFNSKAELEQHNRTMHSRYTCEACGETFNSESELEAHNRKAHPEMQKTGR